jgi:hypothetical protein
MQTLRARAQDKRSFTKCESPKALREESCDIGGLGAMATLLTSILALYGSQDHIYGQPTGRRLMKSAVILRNKSKAFVHGMMYSDV